MILNKNTQLKHGEYVIIDSLGQGGFGITYLAEQVSLKRKVAIKEFFLRDFCNRDSYTLRVSSTGSTDVVGRFRDKFLKEAYTIAGLDHPNIVRIIDVFEENDTAYYVMEYHSGYSLGSVVDKQGAMSEEQALRYIRQVASALKYIHSRRMMHLDIKPDNILLNSRGEAVLIDFGISKVFEDEIDNVKRPRTSTIAAYSPGFAPKEQYNPKGVTEFSPATDIYSLGATLFTLLIGECPPPAIELDESDYIITTLKRSNISKQLSAAVIKAMAYTKKDRPQSVDEFLALLNGGSKEPKKPFNWKPLVGIIAAILCIVFAGVGINECNDYHNKLIRLDSIAKEKAHQDSIAAVKRYNDSIAMVKRHNDSINKALANKVAELQLLDSIANEKAYQDSIAAVKRYNDSIANLPGELYVDTNPVGAIVTVDGKRIGTTPINAYKLKKGSYTVKITKDGYNTISKNITISNEPAIINIALTKTVKKETKNSKEKDNQNNKPTKQEIEKYYNDGVKAYNTGNYTEAVKWYRKAAEQGYARAQNNLGECYENGDGVEQDYTEAVKWYRKAVEQRDAYAQFRLGYAYIWGYGVEEDDVKGYKLIHQAAERGIDNAQLYLGFHYYNIKNIKEAIKWHTKAAEQGAILSQLALGDIYKRGEGVDMNFKEAAKWYRKAAELGSSEAQSNLGDFYFNGQGVEKDYYEAVKWYTKAAEQEECGIPSVFVNLGICHIRELGGLNDIYKSVELFRKAAELGSSEAQSLLGLSYYVGQGVPQNYTEAVKWYQKAAEQGNASAQYTLAYCYEKGLGISKDYAEAVKWYQKAAEQGVYEAKKAL